MRKARVRLLVGSILSLCLLLQAQTPDSHGGEEARAARAIKRVRELQATRLDRSLPSKSFESWLKSILGVGAELKWELNDCGEQTGDPKLDAGRDFPTCVEVQAINPHGDAQVVVSIAVGSVNRGVGGKPQLWFASVEFPRRLLIPDHLHCLPLILRSPKSRSPDTALPQESGCKITEGRK